MARLEGFEPTTPGSEDRCSCPLSYRRIRLNLRYTAAGCRQVAARTINGGSMALRLPTATSLVNTVRHHQECRSYPLNPETRCSNPRCFLFYQIYTSTG
jgi:hypothetical protein